MTDSSSVGGRLTGPIEVVGTGLLGTSIGLACRRAGLEVILRDTSAEHLRTATGLGAGRARGDQERPQLVVVAVPPDHLGDVVLEYLSGTEAVVTDVGSIKSDPARTGNRDFAASVPTVLATCRLALSCQILVPSRHATSFSKIWPRSTVRKVALAPRDAKEGPCPSA